MPNTFPIVLLYRFSISIIAGEVFFDFFLPNKIDENEIPLISLKPLFQLKFLILKNLNSITKIIVS